MTTGRGPHKHAQSLTKMTIRIRFISLSIYISSCEIYKNHYILKVLLLYQIFTIEIFISSKIIYVFFPKSY